MECYNINLLNYNNGILNNVVDCVYILTMKNSSRKAFYMNQLNKFILHDKIFIVNNSGFKNCNKKLCYKSKCKKIERTCDDLTHAYTHTANHALKKNFERILILEDDFILSDDLKNKDIIKVIESFVKKNKKKYIFSLGVIPIISTYYNSDLRRCLLSLGSHATIFPKNVLKDILKYSGTYCDIDISLNLMGIRYIYKKPLIYQTFPNTENSKTWGNNCVGKYIGFFFRFIFINLFKLLNLTKTHEPGTSIMYILNKITYDLILPFVLIIYLKKIYFNTN